VLVDMGSSIDLLCAVVIWPGVERLGVFDGSVVFPSCDIGWNELNWCAFELGHGLGLICLRVM
jgi:hypothetical protein